MVKTLVFTGLKFTFHNFMTNWIRCANHGLKPDGDEVDNEKGITRLCRM